MTGDRSSGETDRLKYLRNADLREEIAYAVGGDPTRFDGSRNQGLKKREVLRVARRLQPKDDDIDVDALDLEGLYERVCRWAGGEYQPNAGNAWKLNRENLKKIHRAVDAEAPKKAVADGGTESDRRTTRRTVDDPQTRTVECWRCGKQRYEFESCHHCGASCKPLTKKKQKQQIPQESGTEKS